MLLVFHRILNKGYSYYTVFRWYYLTCLPFHGYCAFQDSADADDGEEFESPAESPEVPPSFSRVLYVSGDKQEVTQMLCI